MIKQKDKKVGNSQVSSISLRNLKITRFYDDPLLATFVLNLILHKLLNNFVVVNSDS